MEDPFGDAIDQSRCYGLEDFSDHHPNLLAKIQCARILRQCLLDSGFELPGHIRGFVRAGARETECPVGFLWEVW